jgi:hypothetical protein
MSLGDQPGSRGAEGLRAGLHLPTASDVDRRADLVGRLG